MQCCASDPLFSFGSRHCRRLLWWPPGLSPQTLPFQLRPGGMPSYCARFGNTSPESL